MKLSKLALTALFLMGTLSAQIPTDSLVAYYPFNGNANDESANSNDGTVVGATLTMDRFGNANKAYSFDGTNDLISLPPSTPGTNDEITISVWVNAPTYSGSNWPSFIGGYVNEAPLYNNNIGLGLWQNTGHLHLELHTESANFAFEGDISVPWGEWFLAVLTYDGSIIREYLNSTLGHSYGAAGNLKSLAGFSVGEGGWGGNYFTGDLDDIRIYNRVLNAAEITALYQEGGWGPVPPAVVSTLPAQNALNVAQNSTIAVTFDQNMGTATSSNFVAHGKYTGAISGAYSTVGQTITFTPTNPFTAGEQISISLTTGLQNAVGVSLAVSYSFGLTTVSVGAGTFYLSDTISGADWVAVADMDNDGDLDWVVPEISTMSTHFYRNDGSGRASLVNTVTHASEPRSPLVADFDNDGDNDVAVIHADSVTVLLNDGAWSFSPIISGDFGTDVSGFGMADFDGDGYLDLSWSEYNGSAVNILRNDGTGMFAIYHTASGLSNLRGHAAGDLDNDGDLDLAIPDGNSSLYILTNPGDGRLELSSTVNIGGTWPSEIVAGDFDGDGDLDIAVAKIGSDLVAIFKNDGTAGFSSYSTATVGDEPRPIATADMDGDGDLDLAVGNTPNIGDHSVSILHNDGSGNFSQMDLLVIERPTTIGGLSSLAFADVDDDNDIDLAVANTESHSVSLFFNGDSTSIPPTAPTNLAATAGDGQINLHWNPNTEADFLKYYIYGGVITSPTTKVDSTAGGDLNDTSATIIGLANGTTYYYRITALDSSGNESAYSNEVSATPVDLTSPTVTSISSTAANGTYATGSLIPITITFTEGINVTGTPQLILETGSNDATVDYSSGSGTTTLTFNYTVAAGHASNDLDYQSTGSLLLNGGSIKDAAGNSATLILPTPGTANSLAANKALVIDGISPTVNSVFSPAADGTYSAGAVLPIVVSFSEAALVTGIPQLILETGTSDAVVDYSSGSGSSTLTFDYTVQVGHTSSDLDYVGTSSLILNGGTINDGAGNDATLTLPAPGTAGSLGANKAFVILNTPPIAPTNLAATAGDEAIDLHWNPNTEADFLKYYIYGGTTSGPTTVVDSTTAGDLNDTTASLTGLSNGTTYYYRITAVDSSGNESAYSSEASETPIPLGLADTPWPMFSRDAEHTGRSTILVPPVTEIKWNFKTGGQVWSSPVIGPDSTIYFGSDDKSLYAINPDGTEKWKYTTPGQVRSSPAIAADGTIYVGSSPFARLNAINPDGTEKWVFTGLGDAISSPAIGPDGTVYIGGYPKLYAINPDGTEKWSYSGGGFYPSPALAADGTIYIGSDDNMLYAINSDGSLKWTFTTGWYVRSAAAIGADGTVYVGSLDGNLYALNPDGTEKWRLDAGLSVYPSPAIGADSTIYVGSNTASVHAIDPAGAILWTFSAGASVLSSPAIDGNGTIYIGSSDDKIYAINGDGTERWSFTTGGNVYSSPAIGAAGIIYVGSDDSSLYAIGGTSDQPPAAPTGLVATASDQQIDLHWNPNSEADFLKYYIYGGVTQSPTTKVDSSAGGNANDTTATLTSLSNGTTYYYQITAVDSAGNESAYSTEVSETPAYVPAVLHVSTTGANGNDGSAGAPLRNIQVALSAAQAGDTIKVSAGTYSEGLIPQSAVVLLGGYPADFNAASRDIFVYRTIIQGVSTTMFTDNYGCTVDGFEFNGNGVSELGLKLTNGSIATHNIIRGVTSAGASQVETTGGVVLVNNTIAGSGALALDIYTGSGTPVIKNNIITGHAFGVNTIGYSAAVRTYNDVYGNTFNYLGFDDNPGIGDISLNADFLDAANFDYRLSETSPARDAGDPSDDVGDEPVPNSGRINMGVYGGTHVIPPDVTPPAAPTNLTATAGDEAIDLHWNPNTEADFLKYYIYGGVTQSPATKVDSSAGGNANDTTAIITSLSNGTTYYYSITAVDSSGNPSSRSNEVNATPSAPPIIVSKLPLPNALNVPRDAAISVIFDQAMDAASLDDTTFVVHGSQTGRLSGTYTYNAGNYTATFTPTNSFKIGEQISVTLTTGIQNASSVALAIFKTWSFTVSVQGGSGVYTAQVSYGTGSSPRIIHSGDLDGDGDLDVATANNSSDDVSVLMNNGNATFSSSVEYAAGMGPYAVISADQDGDNDLDLIIANSDSSNISVLLNNGNGTFAPKIDYPTGDGAISVFSADLNGDGDPDLAVANSVSNDVSVLLNNGIGTFAASVEYPVGFVPYSIYSADLEGDGDQDLATANRDGNNVSVLLNNGDGTFAAKVDYAVGTSPHSVISADLDGDGDLDLAVANLNANNVSVLLNTGNGIFAPKIDYPAGDGAVSVFAADLDADGDLDLAATNWISSDLSILLNDGNGLFAASIQYAVGSLPYAVFPADFDGDGDLDLAVANTGSSNISVLMNIDLSDTTAPAAPTGLVTSAGDQQIDLHWNPNSETDFLKYYIYGGVTQSPTTKVDSSASGNSDDTTATISGLSNGTTYYYRITAVDSTGNESAYSNKVEATPVGPAVITLSLTGMTPHLNQKVEARLVDLYSGREVSRASNSSLTSAAFSLLFGGVPGRGDYEVEIWADFNNSGAYEPPNADHAWRYQALSVPADTTLTFSHNTNFIDVGWRYLLTANLTGFTGSVGARLEARLVDRQSGRELSRKRIDALASSEFTLTLPGLVAGRDYDLEIYLDANGNGRYDPADVDEAWRIPIDNVITDRTVSVPHSTSTTNLDWPALATLLFSDMGVHLERKLGVRLIDINAGRIAAEGVRPIVPLADFSVDLPGISPGGDYRIDFYVDKNGNGQYDVPPTDEAWRIQLGAVVEDTMVAFIKNTSFTDIQWDLDLEPPAAPTGLIATAGDSQVDLVWNSNTEADFLRYRIYGGTTAAPSTLIDSTLRNGDTGDTLFTIAGLSNGTTYYYRITAVDSSWDESDYSNEVNATPEAGAIVEENYPTTDGTISFGETGVVLEISFGSQTGDDTITVSLAEVAPDGGPPAGLSMAGDRYWTIIHKGSSTFSIDLTLNVAAGTFTADEQAAPGNLQLLRRESDGSGAWVAIRRATSATDSIVTFAGLTGFSQFVVSRNTVTDNEGPTFGPPPFSMVPTVSQPFTISDTLSDPAGVRQVTLQYLKGGQTTFSPLEMNLQSDAANVVVPGTAVTAAGILYFIQATDSLGNQSYSDTVSIPVEYPADTLTTGAGSAFLTDFPYNKWRLISLPGDIDTKSVLATIQDDLGESSSDASWKMYKYIGPGTDDFQETTTFELGESYFLKQIMSESPVHLDLGSGKAYDLLGLGITVPSKQWKFVSSPYPFTVTVNADTGVFNGPYTYGAFGSGGQEGWSFGQVQTSFKPWGGYIIYNTSNQDDTLMIDPAGLLKSVLAKRAAASDGWLLTMAVEGDNFYDGGNVIGRRSDAMEGLDRHDRPEAPLMESYLSVVAKNSDWPDGAIRTADVRSNEVTDGAWNLELHSNGETGPVMLTYVSSGDQPEAVVLLDLLNRSTVNISAGEIVEPITEYSERFPYRLKLFAGSRSFVETAVDKTLTGLPQDFALYPNFPNPFNPTTTIGYTLPRPSQVSLKVYNLLGQDVVALVDEWMDMGRYEARWGGRDRAGNLVATGIYFAVLQIPGHIHTQKMVLLK